MAAGEHASIVVRFARSHRAVRWPDGRAHYQYESKRAGTRLRARLSHALQSLDGKHGDRERVPLRAGTECEQRVLVVLTVMLENSANPNAVAEVRHPLHYATTGECMRLLLSYKADIDAQNWMETRRCIALQEMATQPYGP